jgi:hypothetical protein
MPALPEEDIAGIKAALTQGPLSLIPEEAPSAPTGPFGANIRPPAFDLADQAAQAPGPLELPTQRGAFQAPDIQQPSTLRAVGEGVGESATGTADFMLSPVGIATLGMGALSRPIQRLISLAFAGQMGAGLKDAARELGTEFGKPAAQRDPKKIAKLVTDITSSGAFATAAGFHGVGPAADLPMPFLNRFGNRPLEGPPAPGNLLQIPRGAPVPRGEAPPGLQLTSPEESAARAEQMTREATAGFGPKGLAEAQGDRLPRLEVPEGPSDPRVGEIRDQGLREINQILAKYPDLKGNREDARALRNDAFPEMRKETDATRKQREQQHQRATQGADVPAQPEEVRPAEGEPDRGGGRPVGGAEEQAPVQTEIKPATDADEAWFKQQLGEIQARQAQTINAEIVKTVQEKGWAALDESDRRFMTPEQRKAYKAWVDAGKPEGGGKVKPREEPPTEEGAAPPTEPTPPAPAAGTASPHDLKPALRTKDGRIIEGQKGNVHDDIYKSLPGTEGLELKVEQPEHGFMYKGEFKTRREAADMLGEKDDLQSERLNELQKPTPTPAKSLFEQWNDNQNQMAALAKDKTLPMEQRFARMAELLKQGEALKNLDPSPEKGNAAKGMPPKEPVKAKVETKAPVSETKPAAAATPTPAAETSAQFVAKLDGFSPAERLNIQRTIDSDPNRPELAKWKSNWLKTNEVRKTAKTVETASQIADLKRQLAKEQKALDKNVAKMGTMVPPPIVAEITRKISTRMAKIQDKIDALEKAETKPAEPTTPPVADRVSEKLDSAAEAALQRIKKRGDSTTFGSGPLHELPNIADYAIYGAAKLAKFGLDKARFAAEMIAVFGKRISPHLDRLFDEAKLVLDRHYEIEKAKATPIQQIIGEATGAPHAKLDTIGKIVDTLQSGLKTVRALRDHFTDKPHISRAEVKLADDFLEADANRIRESLTDLIKKELPPSQRGIFITAINNATKRTPLLQGDPEAMYRRAAEVAARIEEHGVNVQRTAAVNAIKDNVAKALASPTVDIAFKSKIGDLVKNFNFTNPTEGTLVKLQKIRDYITSQEALGRDVAMPKAILESLEILNKTPIRDLPLHVLEAMRDRIALLDEMGRRTVATRQLRWENEKEIKTRELSAEPTNPIDKRPEFTRGLVEGESPTQKIRNFLNRRMDGAALFDKALLPIDALFDLLGDAKANYKGWLFKHVRNPIDLGFNAAIVMRDRIAQPLVDLIKKHNLNEQNEKRVGIYADLQQEGGRERLLAMGATPAELSRIETSLTAPERAAYNYMRSALDELLPLVQKVMHDLYNIPVDPVENYFPMPRDPKTVEIEPKTPSEPKFGEETSFDDLGGFKDLYGDYTPRTTKTERGFTIERQPGAKTGIKINAFDVFNNHINDVAYLLSTQRDIKMIGEMAKSELFAEKYGQIGQSMVLNWLDTVARQGKIGGFRRWDLLDTLRKNTSVGVIGFRLASQFFHLSNIPLAMERTGVLNYGAGVKEAFTERGQKFLQENFAETFARGGGEPALDEAMKEGASVFGKQIVPKSYVKAGFYFARMIDQKNSQATVLGMYFRALKEKGIDPSQYAELPVDKEAQARALVMARRAVASPLPKDVPMILSRGAMVGNNVSIGRALFQFQNIFLDQWSNIRHDFARAGIREVNPVKAARIGAALATMVLLETGIREVSKEAIAGVTGYKPKKKKQPIENKMLIEAVRRFPVMGQLTAAAMYGETGVPVIDSLLQIPRSGIEALTAKKAKASDKGAIRAVAGAAQVAGVPGASQIGELIEKSQ